MFLGLVHIVTLCQLKNYIFMLLAEVVEPIQAVNEELD